VDKADLITSLNRLDIWLWVFGLLTALGAAGSTTVGILRLRGGNQLERIQEAENSSLREQVSHANRELLRFKAQRMLSDESGTHIAESLRPFAKTSFAMAMVAGDQEALGLLKQVVSVLKAAGWRWVDWNPPGGPMMTTYTGAGIPNIGQDAPNVGVLVEINPDHFGALVQPSTALVAALNEAGIIAKAVAAGTEAPNRGAINIRIGKKPPQ
jgi:hypothetical protein